MAPYVLMLCVLLGALLPQASAAATFRWSSQWDHLSADPHGANEGLTNALNFLVYEPLVWRGKKLEAIPGLAVSWRQTTPTTWVFQLRKGVRFHDGTPFTADDVVFSVKRAQGSKAVRVHASTLGEVRALDEHTVEFRTPEPNPLLSETTSAIAIMSRAWAQRHRAEQAQNFRDKEEGFSTRNSMGTGPFMLVSREPDRKSVYRKHPAWWGLAQAGYWEGNVEEFVYLPIKRDATRIAALLSGEVDFVLDPPVQDVERLKRDPRVKVVEGPENRVVFLGMDQRRDELLYSSVKGANPFKDRRVRLAVYQAIDVEAIRRTVMRGASTPTAINLPNPEAAGMPAELERRYPYDPQGSRRLLAEAGYANGFDVTLDCPNGRYVNDEKICLAVATMLSKVSVRTKVNSMPPATYFPKLLKGDVSMFMLGWGTSNPDALGTLQPVLRSRNGTGDGDYNIGGYADAELDALIDAARTEMDAVRRLDLTARAMKRHHEMIYHIPLHRQFIPWAMRPNVSVVHRPNNGLQVTWVTVR